MTARTAPPQALFAVAVVVLAGGAVAATSAVGPAAPEVKTAPTEVAASHAQLSCPGTAVGKGVTTDLFAVTPPLGSSPKRPGELAVDTLSTEPAAQTTPIEQTDQVGEPLAVRLGADATPSVTVAGAEGLAPGAYAAQSTTFDADKQGGLAVAPCLPTADSWWFAGLDTSVGSTSRLVLSNPSPAIAVVDLSFYDRKGVVEAPGRSGIPLAPHARQSLDLARFAPGRDAVTLHVRATRGRVAAAVNVARLDGVSPAGEDWIAPSQPPAADVLVNPGDSGGGVQRLVLTNVSGREALVSVRVLEPTGPFIPESLADLRLQPGRTVVKDVSQVTKDAAAFEVKTDQEQAGLVASLVSESTRAPVDLSTASSSPAMTGPAVVPVFAGSRTSVALASASPGGGVVQIQGYDDNGSPVGSETRVVVKAGTTETWEPKSSTGLAYLVATVSDGEVHGVAQYQGQSGRAAAPIVAGPTTVTRPAVRPGG